MVVGMKHVICTLIGCLLAVWSLFGANTVRMDNTSIYAGDTVRIPVSMANDEPITSLMMDLYLPDCLGLDYAVLTQRKSTGTSLSTAVQPNGAIRLLAYSTSNQPFSGLDGSLIELVLWAKDATPAGIKTVALRNIVTTTPTGTDLLCADVMDTVQVCRYATTVQTPTLTYDAPVGQYTPQVLSVGSVPDSAIIRFTRDGSEPNRYSETCDGSINVLENGTIKVMVSKTGMNSSTVAACTITNAAVVKPVIHVTGDSLFTLTCATPGAVIVYTMDGSTPTTESFVYRHPISFDGNYIINALALKPGNDNSLMASDTIKSYIVKKPILYRDANNRCFLSCATPNASIYYTWDGSLPSATNGTLYNGIFPIEGNGVLKAVGVKNRYYNSEPDSLIVNSFTVADPVIELMTNNRCQMKTSTLGASIYYTLDGSTPTSLDSLYKGPFDLTGNGTLKAIALKNRYHDSHTISMEINTFKVSTPTIHYNEASKFSLISSTEGALIYYTTDGSTPTEKSQLFTSPVTITQDCQVRAIGVKPRYYTSEVATFKVTPSSNRLQMEQCSIYVGDEQTVTLSLFNDTLFNSFVVDMYLPEGFTLVADSLYYTGRQQNHVLVQAMQTDSAVRIMGYSLDNQPFTGTSGSFVNLRLRARDYLTPHTGVIWFKNILFTSEDMKDHVLSDFSTTIDINVYDSTVVKPFFSLENDTLVICTPTDSATIHYTLDGSQPTRSSQVYSAPIVLTENCVVKALAVKKAFNISPTDSLVVEHFRVDSVTIAVENSRMPLELHLGLSCPTVGAAIHYTTDGTEPTKDSPLYTDSLVLTENSLIKAIAFRTNWHPSALLTSEYRNFKVATPSITIYNKRLIIACETANTHLYYTLDGTEPTDKSLLYTDTVLLTGNCEIKAIALRTNYISSDVAYNVFGFYQVSRPTIQLIGDMTACTIQCSTPNTTIYYTLDGSEPDSTASLYDDTLSLSENVIIKAVAYRHLYKRSEIARQSVLAFGNRLFVDSLLMTADQEVIINLCLENDTAFTALVTDIALPDGFSIYEQSIHLSSRAPSSHTLTSSRLANGSIRFVVYSPTNEPFEAQSGPLLFFTIYGNDGLTAGKKTARFTNTVLTAVSGNDCHHDTIPVNLFVDGYPQTVMTPRLTYTGDSLIMVTDTPDATIYYTTDGSNPTRLDRIYSGPLQVMYNGTYKARAYKQWSNRSLIDSVTITDRQTVEPVIVYKNGKLWLSTVTPGASLYYTLDGSEPTTRSSHYTVPVTLSSNGVIKAIATCPKMLDSKTTSYLVYKIGNHVSINDFSVSPTDRQTVSINLDNNKAFSAFVMDLTLPGGFHISGSDSLHLALSLSDRCSSTHTLTYHQLSDSTVRIMAYSSENACFSGMEGSILTVMMENEQLPYGKYRFLLHNCFFTTPDGKEEVFSDSEGYALISTHVMTPSLFAMDSLLTMECATLGANIYYTLDGSDPSLHGLLYTKPIVLDGNGSIKALAKKDFCTDSEVTIKMIDWFKVKTPTMAVVEELVSLQCQSMGASIFYTIDGTMPTDSSLLYTGPFALNPCMDWIIKAVAYKEHHQPSDFFIGTIEPLYAWGDANGDHFVNVTDVATVIYHIAGKDSIRFVFEAADISNDQQINVADVVGIVNTIMGRTVKKAPAATYLRAASLSQVVPAITLGTIELKPGELGRIPVYFTNQQHFSAFQLNVNVADGIQIESVELNTQAATPSHQLMSFKNGSSSSLVLTYSMQNAPFKRTEEPIAFINVRSEHQLAPGEYTVSVDDIMLVNPDMGTWKLEPAQTSMLIAGVASIPFDEDILSIDYYSIEGKRLNAPQKGLNIIKTRFRDGRQTVSKVMISH